MGSEDVDHLVKLVWSSSQIGNIDHLRHAKKQLESRLAHLERQIESKLNDAAQRELHYRELYEHAQQGILAIDGGVLPLEVSSLHRQLSAAQLIKDSLNKENLELRERLQSACQAEAREESHASTCVICMDNLANVVSLPCKHLALCSSCSSSATIESCPLCRSPIDDRMEVFMP